MAAIKYTSIINSFVSQEGAGGVYTNHIYYSLLVVYTDGTKEIFEGKKADLAPLLFFLRTPVDELQDIKQIISGVPSEISDISKKIDDKMSCILDTLYPIPDVRGMNEDEAAMRLKEHGLIPNIFIIDGELDNKGSVSFLQRSKSNFKQVDVGISHVVPAVDGLTKDVAVEVLEKAGFQTNVKYVPSNEQEEDIVLHYYRFNELLPIIELEVGGISEEHQKNKAKLKKEYLENNSKPVPSGGWRCAKCGKPHYSYESGCSCGSSRFS